MSYIVVSRSLSSNDWWKPIAGPFKSEEDAQQVAMFYRDNGIREGRENLYFVRLTEVRPWEQVLEEFGELDLHYWLHESDDAREETLAQLMRFAKEFGQEHYQDEIEELQLIIDLCERA